ncbi:YceK/YidQ family lipoprotein [Microbulbifer celer]|uniref:YceK/YidQ family lipoprotein n=1 Tax=Microbulbifer celer TaxID=435905 RepID=A0ABW3U6Y3_9GAMM|nr:YceK/YidQ family lipoprotein [Microbulbifer celer]UFN58477.1 YceK/YidQ family lipoprotein [Microbulbifer celer]
MPRISKPRSLFTTLLATLPLTACGTFTTLTNSDQEVAANLKRQKTHCQSLPRVYSGVSYNACKLNSTQDSMVFGWVLGFYVFDSVASAATDTIALPFTLYRQNRHGNLQIDQQ